MIITASSILTAGGAQPFAEWREPGEILCVRPEPCRKCSSRVLVSYILAGDGNDPGYSVEPIGACGDPLRCGEKVLGITPEEAFGWRPQR